MGTTLLKIPEVAKRLNCSESFVYAIIAEGRLKHYRLGKGQGGLRVSEAQLEAYLVAVEEGGEAATRAEAPAGRRKYRHLT